VPYAQKSKSSTHLSKNGTATPNNRTRNSTAATAPASRRNTNTSFFPDTDFLFRVGSVIASETREAKGQSWLVTRASSTASLPVEREGYYASERDALDARRQTAVGASGISSSSSRRGSRDDYAHYGASGVASPYSAFASPMHSRFGSRAQSRRSSRVMTPAEMRRAELLVRLEDDPRVAEDYFGRMAAPTSEDGTPIAAPAFVGLNERLEFGADEEEDEGYTSEDEAYIRRLARERGFLGSLLDKLTGGGLAELAGDDEESEPEEYGGENDFEAWKDEEQQRQERPSASLRRLQECTVIPLDCTNDPPPQEDKGGWSDASWLLKVAAKAFF
jgi:hypothetical protein